MSRTDHHLPFKFRNRRDDLRTGFALHGISRVGLTEDCTLRERRARAELRAYTLRVACAHRAGADIESILEPDARTRHRGHWDFW